MKKLKSISFVCILFVAATAHFFQPLHAQAPRKDMEVISEGVGRTTADAAQNAAQNALTNIVGSFVDSNKILEKRIEINEGIRSETKSIKTNIKEYSQGSIRRFEILDASGSQGELVRVQARVTVRADDFRAYIKKLAEAEVKVDEGLFAQMRTEDKNNKNAASILHDNIMVPIVNGEVVRFNIGKPQPFSQLGLTNNLKIVRDNGVASVVGFEVEAILDPSFQKNMMRSLEEISKLKSDNYPSESRLALFQPFDSNSDVAVAVQHKTDFDGQAKKFMGTGYSASIAFLNMKTKYNIYVIGNSQLDLKNSSFLGQMLFNAGVSNVEWNSRRYSYIESSGGFKLGSLVVEIKDSTGAALPLEDKEVIMGFGIKNGYAHPWSLIGKGAHGMLSIRPSAKFIVLASVNQDTLRNAKSINIRLTP